MAIMVVPHDHACGCAATAHGGGESRAHHEEPHCCHQDPPIGASDRQLLQPPMLVSLWRPPLRASPGVLLNVYAAHESWQGSRSDSDLGPHASARRPIDMHGVAVHCPGCCGGWREPVAKQLPMLDITMATPSQLACGNIFPIVRSDASTGALRHQCQRHCLGRVLIVHSC